MPRCSERQRQLNIVREYKNAMLMICLADMYIKSSYRLGEGTGNESEAESEPEDNAGGTAVVEYSTYYPLFLLCAAWEGCMENTRYSYRNRYRSSPHASHIRDLAVSDSEDSLPSWLSDDEFLHKFRVTRAAFAYILEEIKDDAVFQSGPRGRKQRSVEFQLMVTLRALGSEGSGFSNPSLRHVFHTGRGTNSVYINRVTTALRNCRDTHMRWPTTEEKTVIKTELEKLSHLPNCVGIIDGTLFPLATTPQTDDKSDYHGRKFGYTLTFLIVCDHRRVVTYYYGGWPGCTHDNRMFGNSPFYNNPANYMEPQEYIIGDSAFQPQWFCVPAYSRVGSTYNQELFNKNLSKARVISEHCIGLLKGRFPWLRPIRKPVSKHRRHMRAILHLIDATIILHNMLIRRGEDTAITDWENQDDAASEVNDETRIPDMGDINAPIPEDGLPSDRRAMLTDLLVMTQGH
jgi:hypothetical protein